VPESELQKSLGKKCDRPSREWCLMETARIWAKRGTCLRAEVGSVLEKEGRIISLGYVGSSPGKDHCLDKGCLMDKNIKGCVRGTHSEINVIGFAARYGISTEGSTLYVTVSPCLGCSQAILASGIKKVVYLRKYRDLSGIENLKRNNIIVEEFLSKGGEVK